MAVVICQKTTKYHKVAVGWRVINGQAVWKWSVGETRLAEDIDVSTQSFPIFIRLHTLIIN